ncbi:MAG: ATP--guanido phosphotransferase [Ruminococcaceae bacterium]|nr:ATP--guanido phosphotransferase [Oscillospiraceae bacterium]
MSEAVVSTRIRLARNLADYSFPVKMSEEEKLELCDKVSEVAKSIMDFDRIDMQNLTKTQAVSLVEQHLISPEFISQPVGKTLLLSKDKTVSIMLNEEDHIRLQVIKNDLCLDDAYALADEIDTKLSENLKFAYSDNLGYLTQCPTNLGTGMRASVMLHLPALQKSKAVSRIASNLSKLGLTIRGIYGESSEPTGAMYQLSNQVSLGISERSAIDNLSNIANQLVTQEIKARDRILCDIEVIDTVCRSLGILKTARLINHAEAMSLLSNVRLGVAHKIVDSLSLSSIDKLICDIQPASIIERFSDDMSVKDRDIKRADYLREKLN